MAKSKAITRYRYRRRKNPGRRRGGFRLPPLAIIGGLVPAAYDILAGYRANGIDGALGHVSLVTTGWDPADNQWKPGYAASRLYGPLLLGSIVHKVANGLGVNRMLAAAGAKFLRI